jgi:hypothetical protein
VKIKVRVHVRKGNARPQLLAEPLDSVASLLWPPPAQVLREALTRLVASLTFYLQFFKISFYTKNNLQAAGATLTSINVR